ncbi:MFS transporter [Kitasatospora sp. NBC_00240]|uniref:MFS transporter n=1 Tax=Kitasatospora sp. NBC_00240 TaxID=2903567 RepID=UPI00224FDAC8|nr:MFS transporter [Kitasatospora sp. NBC_00240]MCX5211800.1 MFS transporter [Kitasatospora sp. NBC_00240]
MSVDPARTARPLSVPGPRITTAAPLPPATAAPPGGRAAWAAWSIGVSAYFLAVIHRTSLGVAGLDAAERFGIGASALSTFSILQVLVYAAMQIPVGLLIDRHGPRKVLLTGVLLLSAGQLAFAFSSSFAPALASRAVLGCGDAMTFIAVLRIAARWFPAAKNPLVTQLTGLAGMGGNLVTTVVLAQALHSEGWQATFTTTALLGIGVAALLALFLREAPPATVAAAGPAAATVADLPFVPAVANLPAAPAAEPPAAPRPSVRSQIRDSWQEPGTRLGLWVHFTTQFPANAFGLLWGLPYLVEGQGMSRGQAGGMLTLLVFSNMVFGLLFGRLLSRTTRARMPITLSVIAVTGAGWAVALAWPGAHPPTALLVGLILLMGSNGPASLVGLDYARAHNPVGRLGTASGIANMGGFIGTMVTLFGIGVLLDALSPAGAGSYSAEAYRWAFCWMYVPLAAGTLMILRLRRKVVAA